MSDNKCNECHKKIKFLSYNCKYCKKKFCEKHHLPEDHNCKKLIKDNIFERLVKSVEEEKEMVLESIDAKKDSDCSYHLCNITQKRISKCPYCGRKFCKTHLKAKLAGMLIEHPRTQIDKLKAKKMREDESLDGHPCFQYTDYWIERVKQEIEEKNNRWNENMDVLTGKTKKDVDKGFKKKRFWKLLKK